MALSATFATQASSIALIASSSERPNGSATSREIAARVESFVREAIIPYERDTRWGAHGPDPAMVDEMRAKARAAGVMTPHIPAGGEHLSHRDAAIILQAAGLSPLGPIAVNVAAPDEGNMFLLGRVANQQQKAHFLQPLLQLHLVGG